MGYGPVNVPGMNAQTLPWNTTDVWHGLSDHENAIATLANLIRWNRWDMDAAIAALNTQDTAFDTALRQAIAAQEAKDTAFDTAYQRKIAALEEADTGCASDIANLKATDAMHAADIADLQTAVEDADLRLTELAFTAAMNVIHTAQLDRMLMEERHKVTLENTLAFPFNSTVNSPASIALDKVRDNAEYSVEAEVLSHDGPVGEIEVTAKARNGFKISYSGSGASVTLLVKVKGGMS